MPDQTTDNWTQVPRERRRHRNDSGPCITVQRDGILSFNAAALSILGSEYVLILRDPLNPDRVAFRGVEASNPAAYHLTRSARSGLLRKKEWRKSLARVERHYIYPVVEDGTLVVDLDGSASE